MIVIVVRTRSQRILVRQRDVDVGAGAAAFRHMANPGFSSARRAAHCIAESSREHGLGVFDFAVQADNGALSVTLHAMATHIFGRQ